jgi:pyruvate kinase
MQKTKIIATLGPACQDIDIIKKMLLSGLSVFRINGSHLKDFQHIKKNVQQIRSVAKQLDKPLSIMMDLGGPKIRIKLPKNINFITINKGDKYYLGFKKYDIPLNTKINVLKVHKNAQIKIDDGKLNFQVTKVAPDSILVTALNSGQITNNKGVNFPGLQLKLPAVTKKDRYNIDLAVELGVDWIAQSFVRQPTNIYPIQRILLKHKTNIPVIAKIETADAIQNLDSILIKYDGILIARGDLGVEMELSKLPKLQKQIINHCIYHKKPCIVATQMLDSMIKHDSPTRAEVNDVANAVYDGVDAIMLSAETAIGSYPIESVQMMASISSNIESDLDLSNFNRNIIDSLSTSITNNYLAVCHAAYSIASNLDIKIIVVLTDSGKTAIQMAQFRPNARIVAITPNQTICNLLSMIWGIIPIHTKEFTNMQETYKAINQILIKKELINTGENFLITSGILKIKHSTNMLQIYQSK